MKRLCTPLVWWLRTASEESLGKAEAAFTIQKDRLTFFHVVCSNPWKGFAALSHFPCPRCIWNAAGLADIQYNIVIHCHNYHITFLNIASDSFYVRFDLALNQRWYLLSL